MGVSSVDKSGSVLLRTKSYIDRCGYHLSHPDCAGTVPELLQAELLERCRPPGPSLKYKVLMQLSGR